MNCKPGDLAVIVRADGWGMAGRIAALCVGHIVRVVKLAKHEDPFDGFAYLVWKFETPIRVELEGQIYLVDGVADDMLRPIRPQADDAQDESLRWLPPVPHTTKEPA